MRPVNCYYVENIDFWKSVSSEDVIIVGDSVCRTFIDPFAASHLLYGTIPVYSIVPVCGKCRLSDVVEHLIDRARSKFIITDIDCMGFGYNDWLEFQNLSVHLRIDRLSSTSIEQVDTIVESDWDMSNYINPVRYIFTLKHET